MPTRAVSAVATPLVRRVLAAVAGLTLSTCAAMTAAGATTTAQQPTSADSAPPAGRWAFFGKYCAKCHNTEDWAGGVAFDALSESDIPQNADVMEKAVRKLRGRLMPPAGKPQPDAEAVREFVSWMEGSLDEVSRERPNPGAVALHRINRKEYANAIRDMLDLQIDPVALLPKDDVQDGFDNVANALQVSPSFLDQYLSAARTVAVQAIGKSARTDFRSALGARIARW